MTDDKLTIKEVQDKHPEIITELTEQITEKILGEDLGKKKAKKLTDAEAKITALEADKLALQHKLGESAAKEFIAAEIVTAKIPEASGKVLTEALVPQVTYAEDGSIDATAFGALVKTAIEAKTAEIEAIRKEIGTGIQGNGSSTDKPVDLKESFKSVYLRQGMTEEDAERYATLAAGGR